MELRSINGNELELRFTEDDSIEIRAGVGEQPSRFVGYVAIFNSLSADLGGFKERIMPGAFKNAITSNADIRALVDHNPEKLLARTSNGTLRLMEDTKGLKVEVDMPDTGYARDARALVARKDVKGGSFGFRVPEGGQRFVKEGGQTIRELSNIDLREVTITGSPAYGDTSISLRVDPSVQRHLEQKPSQSNFGIYAHMLRTSLLKG